MKKIFPPTVVIFWPLDNPYQKRAVRGYGFHDCWRRYCGMIGIETMMWHEGRNHYKAWTNIARWKKRKSK